MEDQDIQDKIKEIVEDVINDTFQKNLETVLMSHDNQIVPRHTHNGVDAPKIVSAALSSAVGNLIGAPVSVLVVSNGTGAVIGTGTTLTINQSSAVSNGYLSSTDWSTFNGKGSVSSVSVVSANGFAGTVATATTTPAITLTTTITGILSGNGTAVSAASTTGSGNVVLATAPTFTTSINLTSSNIITDTTTGTKIGTATTQKLSVWNATPTIQPTTAITAATFVANTSGIVDDTATFDGYTIGQIVKALRNIGLLA